MKNSKNFKHLIPAVNYHLWEPCNMRCGFCFATFQDVKKSILPKGHLPKEQSLALIQKLAASGFSKITFAGGEPTLCPWINELIHEAKINGLTTMIVTNGSQLTTQFMEENQGKLDWITLSIDSLNEQTNIQTGRAVLGKRPFSIEKYKELVNEIKKYGYGLKINTVVSKYNKDEKLIDFIEFAEPSRWKLFQVLPIKEQNDIKIDEFLITNEEFEIFINQNQSRNEIIAIIPENNNLMKGSYVMIDPAGRFFDNSSGIHSYSEPINEIGCENALQQMNYNYFKFLSRNGEYNWIRNNQNVA